MLLAVTSVSGTNALTVGQKARATSWHGFGFAEERRVDQRLAISAQGFNPQGRVGARFSKRFRGNPEVRTRGLYQQLCEWCLVHPVWRLASTYS